MSGSRSPAAQAHPKQRKRSKKPYILAGMLAAVLLIAVPLSIRWFGPLHYTVSSDASGSSAAPYGGHVTTTPATVSTASVTTTTATTKTTTATPPTTTRPATQAPVSGDHYVQGNKPHTPWSLILVNGWNPLPADYSSTVSIVNYAANKQFDARAIDALRQMIQAGSAYKLTAASLYRSVEQQTTLYNRKVNEYKRQGYNQTDAENKAATVVARPGTSEHNTGLAVDILGSGYSSLEQSFERTAAFQWLKTHCAEYGFILRFPKKWESVTGVIYEPWHYRYVGVEYAKIIMERDITLEQFLEEKGW